MRKSILKMLLFLLFFAPDCIIYGFVNFGLENKIFGRVCKLSFCSTHEDLKNELLDDLFRQS